MTHTPGPWEYDRETWMIRHRVSPLQSIGIAEIVGGNESDVHLMTSAPDMLAALKKAFIHTPVGSTASIAVMQAIAKAEGR